MARVTLKIRPGAKRTAFAGKLGNMWKLNVAAPPADGKANEALVKFLAKLTGHTVRIVRGFTSHTKTIEIDGLDGKTLDRAILESHGPPSDTGSA